MNVKKIPSAACRFKAEVEFGDNGEGAKTVPVRLTARSGGAVMTPWFGAVVHDMAGMKLHKNRLAIDYNHDANHIMGYLNHFDISSGDLVTSGALTPFKADDKASEVTMKMRAGVPYESSINFAGDMVIEEFDEGEVEVNGQKFAAPVTVVREWSLRGVAICPYGMDGNTPAVLMSDSSETVNVEVRKGNEMKKPVIKSVEMAAVEEDEEAKKKAEEAKAVESSAVETPVVEDKNAAETSGEEKKEEKPETPPTEEAVDGEKPAETPADEASPKDKEEEEKDEDEMSAARNLFKAMCVEFGDAAGAKYFSNGVTVEQARADHYEALKSENKSLREELASTKALYSVVEKDVDVSAVCTDTVDTALEARIAEFKLKGMSEGQARYAARLNISQR